MFIILIGMCLFVHTIAVFAEHGSCLKQQNDIKSMLLKDKNLDTFLSEFVFTNDTKPGLQLTWTGPDSKILVAVTLGKTTEAADVYRSTDNGRSFVRVTALLAGPLQPLPGPRAILQRCWADPRRIYLVGVGPAGSLPGSDLHVSPDSGASWTLARLPFIASEPFAFHNSLPDLALATSAGSLYVTRDGGRTWSRILDGVFKATWSSPGTADEPRAIYAGALSGNGSFRALLKSSDLGVTWHQLAAGIRSFVVKGGFVFVSRLDGPSEAGGRLLEVSADFGTSFGQTNLPASEGAVTVLDVAVGDAGGDGLSAIVHVGSGNDTIVGTLYRSDASGRLYTRSLERHVYAAKGMGSPRDFYRVSFAPGAYLASVVRGGGEVETVATSDRGGVWAGLGGLKIVSSFKPEADDVGAPALDLRPLSTASASGLVVAHGNAGRSAGRPDLFVSRDGGRSWHLAISGPHRTTIGHRGDVLAAAPLLAGSPVEGFVVWFSTDGGLCWHSYQLPAGKDFSVAGLMSKPGARAATVAVWGYSRVSRHWRVFVLNLADILARDLTEQPDNLTPSLPLRSRYAEALEAEAAARRRHLLGILMPVCVVGVSLLAGIAVALVAAARLRRRLRRHRQRGCPTVFRYSTVSLAEAAARADGVMDSGDGRRGSEDSGSVACGSKDRELLVAA